MAKRTQKLENPFIDAQAGSKALREDIVLTQTVVELLNKDLANTRANATALKTALGDKSGGNLANMQAVNTAMAQAIDLHKQEQAVIKAKTTSEAQLIKLYEKAEQERAKRDAKILADNAKKEASYNKEIAQAERIAKKEQEKATAYNRVQGFLTKLSQEHRNLAIRQELTNKLTAEEIRRMETLAGRIQKYDSALKAVDATQGKHQRNVGNYKSAFNGLGNSVQQLTRELPAFANSMQTGFMAISNNLPIFFDEIKKIKTANVELAATGQPTVSAFKQIAGSIFSVTGVLGLAVTALTVLGPKLIDWIGSLSGANKALEAQKAKQQAVNEQNKKATEFISEESSGYVGLILQLQKTNKGSAERSRLLKKINDDYHVTLKNIQDETKFQEMLNNEVLDYIDYQRLRLKAETNEDLLKSRLKMREEDVRSQNKLKKAEKELREEIQRTEKEFLGDPSAVAQRNGARLAALESNIESQNQLNGAISIHDKRLRELGGTALDTDAKIRSSKYWFEDVDTKTDSIKELTIALKDFDDELSRGLELMERERRLRQDIIQILQDNQIDVVARLARQELENQSKYAEENGRIFVDTLERLIAEEFELRKEALKQRSAFEQEEINKRWEAERQTAQEALTKERDELLTQEGLTADAREKIQQSYQDRIAELNARDLEMAKIIGLEKEKIELELQQALGNLDQEKIDRLNSVNDELIKKQEEYAEKSN